MKNRDLVLAIVFLAVLTIPLVESTGGVPHEAWIRSAGAQLDSSTPRNVVIFYDDYPTRKDPKYQVTRTTARPLVAHLDRNGKPTDWMFDSFIFFSIYLYFDRNPDQEYITSWIQYLFTGGHQISNLDATVAELKAKLHQENYKMKVFLSVPVAIDAVETTAIVKNVDEMLEEWNAIKPKNLRLIGFYWGFTEGLDMGAGRLLDGNIIKAVADYVHSRGLKLLMIPFVNPLGGVDGLHSLGIDYVTIQPNFAWDPNNDLRYFEYAAEKVSSGYADGVEFELSYWVKSYGGDWRRNLNTYIEQGYLHNWNQNLLNTYYHGSDISSMGTSFDSDRRAAYEMIYQFILSKR